MTTGLATKKTLWVYFREVWPMLMFIVAVAVGTATGWRNLEAQASDNSKAILNVIKSVGEVRQDILLRASKFLTDQEISRLWAALQNTAESLEEVDDLIDTLNLSDERFSAKIELEVTKLRSEIQSIAREQQVQLEAQTSVLQQILQEVRSP